MPSILCPLKEAPGALDQEVEKMQRRIPYGKIALYVPQNQQMIIFLLAAFREKVPVFIANTRIPFAEIQKKAEGFQIITDIDTLPDVRSPSDPYWELEGAAVYLLTSGSTAEPKLTPLSLGNLYYSALGCLEVLSLSAGDRYLLSLPLYHVSGLGILFRSLLAKATIVSENPTHISMVPSQLYKMLQEGISYPNLKCILLGGAALSPHLYERGKHLPLFLTYGLTEAASAVVIGKGNFYLGHPLPYREVKVENGEIFVRGKTVFVNEWLATKDLGIYDPQLGLAILGRKDRMFISGGENIQPEEIERVLLQHPSIYEAMVVPKKDPKWGEVPVAFVRYQKKNDGLFSFLQERLPKYKIPIHFFDLETLPQHGLKPNLKKLTSFANSAIF